LQLTLCPMLDVSTEERIATITLNQPEKRNALGPKMVAELKKEIQALLDREDVKIILLAAEGPAFCSGADLEYLSQIRSFSDEENLQDSQNLRELFDLIYNSNKLIVSKVNGPALAGGCGLATICDYCIASTGAKFGYTESRIGFLPALVMVYLRQRIQGSALRDLLLSARIIEATEAKDLGLIDFVVPDDELDSFTNDFLKGLLTSVSGSSIALIKEMLRTLPGMDMEDALDYAAKMNVKARRTEDCMRGIDSFLNKQKIQW
jgi:methylglutaconyl-CoA hydratase